MRRTAALLFVGLMVVLTGCSDVGSENRPSSEQPGDRAGVPAAAGTGQPVSAHAWLKQATRLARHAEFVRFKAQLYYLGFETLLITGRTDPTGYRALGRSTDAAIDKGNTTDDYKLAPHFVRIDAHGGHLRVASLHRLDEAAHWETVRGHLGEWGLTAFGPRRTDLVTLLNGLTTDLATSLDGSNLTVRADLATVLQAVLGIKLVDKAGHSVIPPGSTVPVEITPGASQVAGLHLDGNTISKTLVDAHIDPAGDLNGPLSALNLYIEYPDATPFSADSPS